MKKKVDDLKSVVQRLSETQQISAPCAEMLERIFLKYLGTDEARSGDEG